VYAIDLGYGVLLSVRFIYVLTSREAKFVSYNANGEYWYVTSEESTYSVDVIKSLIILENTKVNKYNVGILLDDL